MEKQPEAGKERRRPEGVPEGGDRPTGDGRGNEERYPRTEPPKATPLLATRWDAIRVLTAIFGSAYRKFWRGARAAKSDSLLTSGKQVQFELTDKIMDMT